MEKSSDSNCFAVIRYGDGASRTCGIVDTKLRGDSPSARGQPFKILKHPTQFSALIYSARSKLKYKVNEIMKI